MAQTLTRLFENAQWTDRYTLLDFVRRAWSRMRSDRMLKTLLSSAGIALALTFGTANVSLADDWEHKGSWVGHDSGDDGYDRSPARISCNRGAAAVRNAGFDRVRARDCNGDTYSYSGRKNGATFLIGVNSSGGRITSVRNAR
jgi:hypothetical protein